MFSSNLLATASMALAILPSLVSALPATMTPYKRQDNLKFNFGNEKVRGVNLGGWLVLEPWITPRLFEATPDSVVDEWTLGSVLGHDRAYNILKRHWDSWMTQDDLNQIARAGMNHVRIPVGYWSVISDPNAPYVSGAYPYLGKALDWAQGAGLKVIIDLHGAPGSQNGFDNSGHRGSVGWTQGDTVARTIKALNKIRDDHANHPAVSAIELLNEPMGPAVNMDAARQFMMDGWGNLRDSKVGIMFHDAFMGVNAWNNWGAGMWALILDTHHYEVFDTGALQMSPSTHVSTACGFGSQMASNNKWTIAGEWTGAMTDCAQWLNGRGKGARYDSTFNDGTGKTFPYVGSCNGKYRGTVNGLSQTDKENTGRFIEAQMDAYEKAAGWTFWTWKTQGAPEWDMQALLAANVFPNPVTRRNYPRQC